MVCILLTQQSPGADYFIGDMGLRLVMPRLQGKVGRDFIAKGMEQIMEGAFDKEASEGKVSCCTMKCSVFSIQCSVFSIQSSVFGREYSDFSVWY